MSGIKGEYGGVRGGRQLAWKTFGEGGGTIVEVVTCEGNEVSCCKITGAENGCCCPGLDWRCGETMSGLNFCRVWAESGAAAAGEVNDNCFVGDFWILLRALFKSSSCFFRFSSADVIGFSNDVTRLLESFSLLTLTPSFDNWKVAGSFASSSTCWVGISVTVLILRGSVGPGLSSLLSCRDNEIGTTFMSWTSFSWEKITSTFRMLWARLDSWHRHFFCLKNEIQWGSDYRTSSVFKWFKAVWSLNGSLFRPPSE